MRLLSLIVLAMWGMALARTILNLLLVPKLRARMPQRTPLLSVIIPARDEEREIGRTVRAMLTQTYPHLEIVVVNDRSTDATPAVLASFDDPRLIVVHATEDPPPGWLGKPWALHQGSLRARGALLLFVDADVIYEPDAIAAAVAHMEERDVPMLALFPHMEMRGFWEHVIMPNLGMFAFSMLPVWLTNRTRIPVLAVGGGPGNLVRRDDYDACGGHESLRDAVVDDVGLARLMRRRGRRTGVVRAEKMISVRMYHGLGEIIRGFTKNAFPVINRNYFAGALFLFGAVGVHILPYALAFTGDAIWLTVVALITLIRVILFRALGYRLDNALFGHPLMIGAWCVILLRSIWFTGIRRQVHWRGRTYDASRTRFGAD
jgi:chlorobactene glucosyltransferase